MYYIHARNANAGIYSESEKGFWISRLKVGSNFLFLEYHWDFFQDGPWGKPTGGSAKPLKEIEKAPAFEKEDDKLKWLNIKKELLPDPWTDKESL